MDLQSAVKSILAAALQRCLDEGDFSADLPEVTLEQPKRPEHGDFACNIALALALPAKRKPRDLAESIVRRMEDPEGLLAATEIAGPGFINLRLADAVWHRLLGDILSAGEGWGAGEPKASPRILIEFVSANPTGPLHVGHGRGAVVGDALARLLRLAGYPVTTEYYLNDAGSQVQKLARSLQFRALELVAARDGGSAPASPEEGEWYPGDYVIAAAQRYLEEVGDPPAGDLDVAQLDALAAFAVEQMRQSIAATLDRMNIAFDVWFSEKSLHASGALNAALDGFA
ncbi:MAG: arginine--tRNA ligase [Anaerolineae bacterium]